ncbi:cadherin-23-like [Saccostrea echinata]|uniref:cadherin-23-like n=1 Tax=Saccostrea echinata TaxID=191078 RepID=UPI002A8276BB|nr:cadherin-23-like [Saccostrea echinata]
MEIAEGNTFASNFPPIIHMQSGGNIQEVNENIDIGTKLFNITAQDRNGGTVTVRATGETSDLVTINQTQSGAWGVFLKKKLDRETQSQHLLRFIAISSKNDAPSQSLEVTLFVNDVNDEPPKFSQLAYRVQVPESAGQASALYGNTFIINPLNGQVTLNQPLDYERLTFYQYTLIAKDGGNPKRTSTADLLITILDVQDTPPIFQGLPYMTTIKENYSVGTTIFRVFAVDGDTGIPNNITYSFSSGTKNCSQFLSVDRNSGNITINKTMDRDDGPIKQLRGVCTVNVKASEVTNKPSNLTKTVKPFTITIEDVNDNGPIFNQSTYYGSVKENMTDIPITISGDGLYVKDIDQVMGNDDIKLQVYKNDSNNKSNDIVASPSLVYSEGTFLLRLTNNFKFDYEKYSKIDLLIKAEDKRNSSMSSVCTVHVTINDTNDNDPIFKNTKGNFSVPENSCFNTTVTEIKATDADSGKYSEITYRLQGSNSFDIDSTTGRIFVNCNKSCSEECKNTECDSSCLDREKKDMYYLTAEAQDGGGRRASVSIVVHLTDTNDNKPIFRDSSYRVGLDEDSTVFSTGNAIFKVEATDKDIGNNNKISYRIVSSDDNQGLHNNFTMDEENGTVTISGSIDYENLPEAINGQIILILVAEDHGSPVQSTNVTLTVDIKDINDNTPEFLQSYNSTIEENSNSGAFVIAVSAVDNDKTIPNNQTAYFIEKGGSDQFTIDGTSGNITVQIGANLDREIVPGYNLTVVAIDKGVPQRTGSVSVIVTVEDENDTPPSWKNLPKTVDVHENSTVNNITTCIGIDLDVNSSLHYSIIPISATDVEGNPVNVSQMKDVVTINRLSGEVSALEDELDAERAIKLIFNVTVNDSNTLKNNPNATSELTINIIDINDNPPVFPHLIYSAKILENVLDDTYVTLMKATDADINEENRNISYYIDDTNAPFAIDQKSGVVQKVEKVDREVKDQWNVTIRATDSLFNTTTELCINILDFNDNTPYFLNETYIFHIEEDTYNVTTKIGTIYANDEDIGENAKIRFSITGGNDQGHFDIDSDTGDLLVKGDIDREMHSIYHLTITIQDSPNVKAETKRNSTQVVVYVQDVNDNAPIFTNDSHIIVIIKETTSIGTTVKVVEAIDKDYDINSNVWYRLGDGGNVSDDWFAINTDTGVINVNNSLKDQAGNYTVEVIATDKGSPSMNTSLLVGIRILDENLHSPAFTRLPANNTVSVYECAKFNTSIFEIDATDADKDYENHFITYQFRYANSSSGQNFESFHINNKTGRISLVKNIDHEIRPLYSISVICTDHGEPPRSTISPFFTIQVLDVNDNPPEFTQNFTNVEVKENRNNTLVTTVRAVDKDSMAVIQYSIEKGDHSDFFQIDNRTGEVRTIKSLDREEIDIITLTVKAVDVTKPENLSSQCDIKLKEKPDTKMKIQVAVQDENDNPPKFTHNYLSKGILSNIKFGTVVIDLTEQVTDRDVSADNRKHHFYATSITYTGPLKKEIENKLEKNSSMAFCVHLNGSVVTNIVFPETMKGLANLNLLANDSSGNTTAYLKLYIISVSQMVAMKFIKTKPQLNEIKLDVLKTYSTILEYDFVYDEMEAYVTGGKPDPFTTLLKFHVVDRDTDRVLEATEVINLLDGVSGQKSNDLSNARIKYSIMSINSLQTKSAEQSSLRIKERYIFIAVIVLLSVILCVILYFFINSTSRYKTKLKAANIPTTDRRNGKKESLYLPGSNVYSSTKNPLMNKEEEVKRSMENLDKLDDVSVSGR